MCATSTHADVMPNRPYAGDTYPCQGNPFGLGPNNGEPCGAECPWSYYHRAYYCPNCEVAFG